ncbi:hypothetical protein E2320_014397 [Naja naja]|nr:hypothetical protein E2320_014397 [Naja naja]
MAAELREKSAPNPLKAEPGKGTQMGERLLVAPTKEKGVGPSSRLIPTGRIHDFWERADPEKTTPEPCRNLQQRWESQLQEFLKVLEAPSLEGGSPQPRMPLPRSDPRSSLASFRGRASCPQQPRAQRGTQLTISLSGETHRMEPPKRLQAGREPPLERRSGRATDTWCCWMRRSSARKTAEDRESGWKWSSRGQPGVSCSPNPGEASETLYWNSEEKAEGKFINSQGTYEDLDESQ